MQSIVNSIYDITSPNFVGIFLYGSQNYGLSTSQSDVDTILIVKKADSPKEERDLAQGKVKIYTVKYFLHRLQKGDLECLEALCTKHKYVNPIYDQDYIAFARDFIHVLNYERTKRALQFKLDEHLNHIFWNIRKTNDRYNKKRLYWAIRVQNQLERICIGESFESSLIYNSNRPYDLLAIKQTSNCLSLRELNEIYNDLYKYFISLPKWSNKVLPEEEKICSNFYSKINKELKSFEY